MKHVTKTAIKQLKGFKVTKQISEIFDMLDREVARRTPIDLKRVRNGSKIRQKT